MGYTNVVYFVSVLLSLCPFKVILESQVVGDARGIQLHSKPTFLLPQEVSSHEKIHVKGKMGVDT